MKTTTEWLQAGLSKHQDDLHHIREIQAYYPGYLFCFTVLDPTVHPEPLTVILNPQQRNELHVVRPLSQLYPHFSTWHHNITEFDPDYPRGQRRLKRGISALFSFITSNWHVMYELDKRLNQEVTLVFDWHDRQGQHLLEHNQFFQWLKQIGRCGHDTIPFGPAGPSITFTVTEDVLRNFTLFAGGFGNQRYNLNQIEKTFRSDGLNY